MKRCAEPRAWAEPRRGSALFDMMETEEILFRLIDITETEMVS